MAFELIPIISIGQDDFMVTVVAAQDEAPEPSRGKTARRPRLEEAFELASVGATRAIRLGNVRRKATSPR